MMAILLRGGLLLELVLLVVGTLALTRWAGMGLGAAIAVAAALVIVINALPIAISFALARRHSVPAAPGTPSLVRRVIAEWLSYVALFSIIQPFERFWMGDDAIGEGASPPVLLIHGYMCNRGVWWWLRRRLRERGLRVATVNLAPPTGGIDAFAAQLHARIEDLIAESGADRVVLVAHSMGGIVARRYLRRYGPARVLKLITLGTPHNGTRYSSWGPGRCAREMERGSDWLRGLPPDPGVPTTSAWSPVDNFILPQDSSRLPGARDVVLPPVTHLAMAFSPAVAGFLVEEISTTGSE